MGKDKKERKKISEGGGLSGRNQITGNLQSLNKLMIAYYSYMFFKNTCLFLSLGYPKKITLYC